MPDLSRREFVLAGTTSLLGLRGSVDTERLADVDFDPGDAEAYQLRGVADLLGPADARPAPGDPFFDDKVAYAYRYEATDTGERWFITDADDRWTELMSVPTNQLDEVESQEAISFFNHTFARPEAPDTKNWVFTDADVTKFKSEIELAATTVLETKQRGNYPPGSTATPGVAFRVTGEPTAGEALAGYFDGTNGGLVGEDPTDSFVELRKGGTAKRVHRLDWNGYVPDERVWVNNRPVITRKPHLFYGGGDFKIRALLHGADGSKLRTLHTFTPDSVDDVFPDGPPFDQPNLPARFESVNLSGGALRANACHYQYSLDESENRVNGEHFTNVSAGTTGWTPLLAWRKRADWEMVNVRPLKVDVAAESADAKLEIQLDPTVSGGTWDLPTNTASSETAVEVNTGVSLDATGQRRWPGYASAGQGNKSGGTVDADLTFNLPSDQVVVLAAQGVGGTATLSGTVGWQEYF